LAVSSAAKEIACAVGNYACPGIGSVFSGLEDTKYFFRVATRLQQLEDDAAAGAAGGVASGSRAATVSRRSIKIAGRIEKKRRVRIGSFFAPGKGVNSVKAKASRAV